MIAGFSRALTEGLNVEQSDQQFDSVFGAAISLLVVTSCRAGPSGGCNHEQRHRSSPMDARLNLVDNPVAAKFLKYIISAGQVVSDSTLPAATQELVRLRASQINGCGFCTDMHTEDAAHSPTRRGRMPPSTTTRTNSPPWRRTSPSSTPSTA
ncbi:MAG TPA: carboxymuconolactone decarboxylase family protein [Streptosporangiaceae bacterium]|jgi:hypothetical protein